MGPPDLASKRVAEICNEEVKMAEPAKASNTHAGPRSERLAFTLDATSGEIIKIESVDSAGQRRELAKPERQELAKERAGVGVEALIEGAFEAGIGCLLGGRGDRKEDESETEDEAGVRSILLKSLMEGTSAARAVRREVLRQAIVQTLIQDATGSGEPESEPPKPHKSDRAAPRAST
jgi:hypothetical protein